MSAISDILKTISLGDLADEVGASKKETKSAAELVIQSLLGGLSANVADGGGEDLTAALQDHAPTRTSKKPTTAAKPETKPATKPTTRKTTKPSPAEVDTDDGMKIIQHILGTTPDDAAAAVSDKTGADQSLLSKLMPILAPIVMAYLAKQMFSQSSSDKSSGGSSAGSVLGGVIGGLLGGSQPAPAQQSSGFDIGGLLGGMLGQSMSSGNSASNSGGLGNLLGKLF